MVGGISPWIFVSARLKTFYLGSRAANGPPMSSQLTDSTRIAFGLKMSSRKMQIIKMLCHSVNVVALLLDLFAVEQPPTERRNFAFHHPIKIMA